MSLVSNTYVAPCPNPTRPKEKHLLLERTFNSLTIPLHTANGRATEDGTSYYVFNKCDIAAASGATVASGAYYLGRPWGEYARVVFQETSMSDVINSAGWKIWNTGDERTDGVLFGEYDSTGTGASGDRASFATTLTSAVNISTILGSNYASAKYYDSTYF